MHTLVVIGEDEAVVMFQCSACGAFINFVKNADEDPHATLIEEQWVPNADPVAYLGECPDAQP